jgi:hypothetical protein
LPVVLVTAEVLLAVGNIFKANYLNYVALVDSGLSSGVRSGLLRAWRCRRQTERRIVILSSATFHPVSIILSSVYTRKTRRQATAPPVSTLSEDLATKLEKRKDSSRNICAWHQIEHHLPDFDGNYTVVCNEFGFPFSPSS